MQSLLGPSLSDVVLAVPKLMQKRSTKPSLLLLARLDVLIGYFHNSFFFKNLADDCINNQWLSIFVVHDTFFCSSSQVLVGLFLQSLFPSGLIESKH